MSNNILLFTFVLMISLISVSATDLHFKRNSDIDLKIPCIENNTICDSSTECNISITYPSGEMYVLNQPMEYNNLYFNYTLSDTDIPGTYNSIIFCQSPTNNGYNSFSFVINNTGVKENSTSWIILLMIGIFLFASIILTIFFYHNASGLKYLFLILSFIFATILSYVGYAFPSEITASMSNILYVIFIIMMLLTVFIIIIVLLELTTKAISMLVKQKDEEWTKYT